MTSPAVPRALRHGADALKAVALHAKMVFAGRPFAYAAAVGGQAGQLPPLWVRLPGFFLLRIARPRSRLPRWPQPSRRSR